MIKKFLSLIFLCATSFVYAEGERFFSITNFNGGLNSRYSSLSIADNEVQQALNVYFDEDNAVVKRQGYTTYGSTGSYAFTNGWTYTDSGNNNWIVVLTSNSIIASSGDGVFSVLIATVPTPVQSLVGAVNAEGRIYFVDQIQGVYYWAGTGSVTYVPDSPKGSLIVEYKGRLWVSGKANPNQNDLAASAYLDGTNWTTGSLATDPITYVVGLNDKSDGITGMFAGLNDAIYLFKNKSIYALYGFDQDDFQVRVITSESGCIDAGSIQPYAGGLLYVSLRGVEIFDGVFPVIVSKKIHDLISPALLSGFNQRSYTQTSQSDWESNTQNPSGSLSTTIIPGSVILSTMVAASQSDNDSTDFNNGSLSNTTTGLGSTGQLSLSFSSTGNLRDTKATAINTTVSGSNGCSGNYYQATQFTAGLTYRFTSVDIGAYKVGSPGNYTFKVLSDNGGFPGTLISSVSISPTAMSTTFPGAAFSFSLSAPYPRLVAGTVYWAQIVPEGTCDGSNNVSWSRNNSDLGSSYYLVGNTQFNENPNGKLYLKTYSSSFTTSGTIVSRNYDVGFTTNTWLWNWGTLSDEASVPSGTTLSYQTQTSADGSNFDSLVPVAAEAITTSTVRRYIRYKATLTTTDQSESPFLSTVTLNTGPFRKPIGFMSSPIQDLGTSITSFGSFDVDQDLTSSGTITYSICTSSVSTLIPSTCTLQSANSQILADVNRYAQVRSTFSILNATHTPRLDRYVVKWNDGDRRPRMASVSYQDRYWLSLTTNSASSYNDATLVLSRGLTENNFVWTLFDIHAGAFITYKGELYHASSGATGKVYKDNQGYNDDGAPINAYVVTKDYALDGIIFDKVFNKLWLLSDPVGNYSLETSYYLDRVLTNEFDLSTVTLNETAGLINMKLPFPFSAANQKMGRTISFKFANNEVDAPMRVYGGNLEYTVRPPE